MAPRSGPDQTDVSLLKKRNQGFASLKQIPHGQGDGDKFVRNCEACEALEIEL